MAVTPALLPSTTQAAPGEVLRFVLVNDGPRRAGFGLGFDVQHAEGERWVDTGFSPEVVPAVGLSLTPGQRFEQRVAIPTDAPLGRYRIRKWVEGAGACIACEFTLDRSARS